MVIGGFLWWWWGWGFSVLFSGLSSVCVSSLYLFPYCSICEVMGFGRRYSDSLHYSWFCVSAALQSSRLHLWEQQRPDSLPDSWQGLLQSSSVQLSQENFCLRYPFYRSSLIHASQRPTRNLFSPFIWEVKHGTEDDAFLPWQYSCEGT